MKLLTSQSFNRPFRKSVSDEKGFTTAQFVGLVGLSLVLLATVFNVLFIEYLRFAAQNSTFEAARAGTQVIDLQKAIDAGAGEEQVSIDACVQRLVEATEGLLGSAIRNPTRTCEIVQDPATGRFAMRAEFSAEPLNMVPWARPFGPRLSDGVGSTYVQRQAAD